MSNFNKDIENKIKKADDLIRKGESSSAVSILKKLINLAPEMTYLHYLLGIARMKCGRFSLAKKALEKADQLEPNRSDNLRSLGWVKVMLGDIKGARIDLRNAISLDLTNPLAYVDLAMSYFHYYEFKEGFEWMERAKALEPNNPYILNNYQTAEEMEKESSKYSKKQLEKMRKEKSDPEIQREFRLSALRKYSEGRALKDDEVKEIKEELKLGGLSAGINLISDEDLFDDCPICQARKTAKEAGRELTEEELKEAFKKAKEGGAIVGGEWFK